MMKRLFALVCSGAIVASAFAQQATPLANNNIDRYFVDYATGNVSTTNPNPQEEGPGVAFDATATIGSFYNGGFAAANPTEDLDWGDLAPGTVVNGFEIGIANDSSTDVEMIINFYSPGNGFGDASTLLASFPLTLPGLTDPINGGIFGGSFVIDLEGGNEFTIPDGDFEYGYEYVSNGNGTANGPLIVLPSTGTDDAWDQYTGGSQADGGTASTLFFGGDPYAQFYMQVFTVPEPSSAALLGLASLFGLGFRRRR